MLPSALPPGRQLLPGSRSRRTREEFLIRPGRLNVLTIHAEVEGIARAALFEEFLDRSPERGLRFVPLGELLPAAVEIPVGAIAAGPVPGREGDVCLQAGAPTP